MASPIRELIVSAIDDGDDAMMCKCGTNCTVMTGCPNTKKMGRQTVEATDFMRIQAILSRS